MSKVILTAMVLIASALWAVSPMEIGDVSATEHSAMRSFSSEQVDPGEEITVTIAAQDYGPFAQVVETLPEGFIFRGTSLSDAAVGVTNNIIKFTLLGDEEFTYTAQAPTTEGEYTFSGVLLDSHRIENAVGGDSNLRVGAAPTPTPEATPTPIPTFEPTAMPTAEPTPTPDTTATPTTTPTSTPRPTETTIAVPAATVVPAPEHTATLEPAAPPTPTSESTAGPVPMAIPQMKMAAGRFRCGLSSSWR